MPEDHNQLREIAALLASQKLCVLATADEGVPYTSIVAFAETADLHRLLFVTTRQTRKFRNISGNSNVALLIDNRTNTEEDLHNAAAVTAAGTVQEIDKDAQPECSSVFLDKHPYLQDFLAAPTTALVALDVRSYIWVDHFQHVVQYDLPA